MYWNICVGTTNYSCPLSLPVTSERVNCFCTRATQGNLTYKSCRQEHVADVYHEQSRLVLGDIQVQEKGTRLFSS